MDLARRNSLFLSPEQLTQQGKVDAYSDLATLAHTDVLELAPEPQLIRDLLSIRKRTTQSGYAIHLPLTSDGRHGDFAPALMLAVKHAAESAAFDFSLLSSGRPRQQPRTLAALGQGGFGAGLAPRIPTARGVLNTPIEHRGLPPRLARQLTKRGGF